MPFGKTKVIEGILGISDKRQRVGEKEAPDGAQSRGAAKQKRKGAGGDVLQATADSGESCPALFSTLSPNNLAFNHRLSPFPQRSPGRTLSQGWGNPNSHPNKSSLC